MDADKTLLVSFETSSVSTASNKAVHDDDSLTREISLDYSDDEDMEMLPERDSPPPVDDDDERKKTESKKQRETSSTIVIDDKKKEPRKNFEPIDDVDVFAVDDDHFDTSGGEIRRKTKVDVVFDADKFANVPYVKRYPNPRLATKGGESTKDKNEMDEFLNSDEQKTRRAERAKRFGLDSLPPDASASTTTTTTTTTISMIDEPSTGILNKLYEFYGIDPENQRHKAKYRLNALFLRGVDNMSTDSIFDFFGPYLPTHLEWIDDNSCNLLWAERDEAARGLLGMTKPMRRIVPSRKSSTRRGDGEKGEDDAILDNEDYVSPLKRASESEATSKSPVPMAADEPKIIDDNVECILDGEEPTDVNVGQITVPPGPWRVGKVESTSQLVLVRFATVEDVKTDDAHRKSRYYREYGNPNFGGRTGYISRSFIDRSSRKRRYQDDNDDDGAAAESNNFATNDLRKRLTDRDRWNLLRADMRRDNELEAGELVEEEDTTTGDIKLTYYSSDEEDMGGGGAGGGDGKRPRMRMRADEEEDRKAEKRIQLQRMKRIRQRFTNVERAGIDGDWRVSQRSLVAGSGRDLRDTLNDARMKVTVSNDQRTSYDKRDLRHRLGSKKPSDRSSGRYDHDDRGEHDDRY